FLPLLAKLQGELTTVTGYIQLSDAETPPAAPLATLGEYESLLQHADSDFDFPDFDENAVATMFYTTGTTGKPKGVYFSHRQLVLHTMALAATMSINKNMQLMHVASVYMPITPMFHVHAWGVPYAATMMGVKQVYPGRYEPATLLKLLVTEKVTFSHCVPTIIQMLLSAEAAKSVDLTGWKVIIGGSALPPALARNGLQRGIDIYTGYGMSETCPLLTLALLTPELEKADIEKQVKYRTMAGRAVPM